MIKFMTEKDDITESFAEVLVNPVNCMGVSGKGLALHFKEYFPDNFALYHKACLQRKVKLGSVFVGSQYDGFTIINFPTKFHWKDKSHIEDIKSGLKCLIDVISELGVKSVAIPALGCGLGGLKWDLVKEEMLSTFSSLSQTGVKIYIYPPRKVV